MDAAESPPAPKKTFFLRHREVLIKPLDSSIAFQLASHLALQRFDKSGNGHQNRDALAPNHLNQVGRLQRLHKNYGAGQERRNEYSQHLAEHVAQRKRIQKTQWMENSLVAKIFLNLAFERFDVCQNIAVGDHYSARLCRGPRSENNLQRILPTKRWCGGWRRIALSGKHRQRL